MKNLIMGRYVDRSRKSFFGFDGKLGLLDLKIVCPEESDDSVALKED